MQCESAAGREVITSCGLAETPTNRRQVTFSSEPGGENLANRRDTSSHEQEVAPADGAHIEVSNV